MLTWSSSQLQASKYTLWKGLPWIKFQNHIESRGNYSTAFAPHRFSRCWGSRRIVGVGHILNFKTLADWAHPVSPAGSSIQESETLSIPGTLVSILAQPESGLPRQWRRKILTRLFLAFLNCWLLSRKAKNHHTLFLAIASLVRLLSCIQRLVIG